MTNHAERCQRCQQVIRSGATFCTSCGAPLANRAARNERNVDHAQRALMDRPAAHAGQIPGTIPVVDRAPADGRTGQPGQSGWQGHGLGDSGHDAAGPLGSGPVRSSPAGHSPGGGTGMAVNLELVPASAGKRLGAAVLDWLGPLAVLVVAFAIGFAGITRTQSGGFIVYDTGSVVLFGGIGLGLTLVYLFVQLGMEGRSGTTIGNTIMGIRSADNDGYGPGAGGIFLRGLVTGAGIILAAVTAIAVVVFKWFDAALLILGPLLLIGAAWAVLVVVSNRWDRNGGLRGWHDRAAKTLVFDVKAGRNPITSGGIQGPYSFAPLDLPPVQPVVSPVAGAVKSPHVINAQLPLNQNQNQNPKHNPNQWQPASAEQPAPYQPMSQPAAPQPPVAVQPSASPQPFQPAQGPGVPQSSPQQPQYQAQPQPFQPQPAPHQAAPQLAPPQSFQPQPFQPPAVVVPSAPAAGPTAGGHPDDDHDRTQMRGGTLEAAPVAVLRIKLDDGRDFQLDRNVLVGRNPVGQTGEQQAQLLAIDDPSRSISKTHLHLLTDGAGIWVTDRNSTNGSAVTTADGLRTPLQPGVPAFVSPGSIVHFGDRSFHLGQA